MNSTENNTHRSAFTLVELLVVISIIALLISLLVPSLQTARQRASKISCMSNLKNLAQASLTYESVNQGALPYWQTWFTTQLPPILGITFGPTPQPTVFTCPAQFKQLSADRTYAINPWVSRSNEPDYTRARFQKPMRRWANQDWVHDLTAATIPHFCDGIIHWTGNGFLDHRSSQPSDSNYDDPTRWPVEFPHDDGWNICFMDGHVEYFKRGVMYFVDDTKQLHFSPNGRAW